MSRLSIEIPDHQHQQIKARAALRGISIKDYILAQTLPPVSAADKAERAALAELEALLAPRVRAARRGEWDDSTMDEIIAEARRRHKAK